MLVFVHGTLRQGQGLNPVMKNALYLGETQLLTPSAILVGLSKTSFPAVVPLNGAISHPARHDTALQPRGELYMIDQKLLARLDEIEGTPAFYRRLEGSVSLTKEQVTKLNENLSPGRRYRTGRASVMYYGMTNDSEWLTPSIVIDSGDWLAPEWGVPYVDWLAARRQMIREQFEAMEAPRAHGHRFVPPPELEPNIMWDEGDDDEEGIDFEDLV